MNEEAMRSESIELIVSNLVWAELLKRKEAGEYMAGLLDMNPLELAPQLAETISLRGQHLKIQAERSKN